MRRRRTRKSSRCAEADTWFAAPHGVGRAAPRGAPIRGDDFSAPPTMTSWLPDSDFLFVGSFFFNCCNANLPRFYWVFFYRVFFYSSHPPHRPPRRRWTGDDDVTDIIEAPLSLASLLYWTNGLIFVFIDLRPAQAWIHFLSRFFRWCYRILRVGLVLLFLAGSLRLLMEESGMSGESLDLR